MYRAPSRGERWLVDVVEYRRIRGTTTTTGPAASGPDASCTDPVAWAEVLERHPEFDEVEFRLDLVEVHLPGGEPEPPEERRHVRVERRDRWKR